MYQLIGDTLTLSVSNWMTAGLTYKQFKHDSADGYLKIFRRGINGNTLIDVKSIQRPERRRAVESVYGPIDKTDNTTGHTVVLDAEALEFFRTYRYNGDTSLPLNIQQQYYNEASILNTLKSIFDKQRIARARNINSKRIRMHEWWMGWKK